ncbi:helix-turn-helix domain-containing protein [Actinoplanes teichomyceticus]|uniref:Helix-turn-helix protein n=1 Tax=Actinoplanes teichomyceticus TaxID=1867 RepID=A0A561VGG0_ACTTI|nr:helix-turn-helix transcriptional regulator [Actinoplanes teichomyceticus]TWG10705.1 helix-turn-helix protein [Actinoplanes teichomyceticus]GIF15471.1 hypothetical protein Ate01nite_55030 [Actinoplanes teichomyceticus]
MITQRPAYDYAALGVAISKARRAAELTVEALGERSGVSRRHLIDIEQGNKKVSAGLLYAIAAGLGIDGGDLFREGYPDSARDS